MTYLYECRNDKCNNYNKTVEIAKPVSESSKEEKCSECKEVLYRVFTSFGVKTADGYKA